jgi:hypothetical protein
MCCGAACLLVQQRLYPGETFGLQMIAEEKSTTTQVVRTGLEAACKEFTAAVAPLGFVRSKKLFWVRRREHTVDFIHFHRSGSSYGAPISASVRIRVHFGIRVLNDTFPAAALNGPNSDSAEACEGRYHLRFNAATGSTFDRCIQDLVRFVDEHGLPWFNQFEDVECLLTRADSPVQAEARSLLIDAIHGRANSDHFAASLKLLGIKNAQT